MSKLEFHDHIWNHNEKCIQTSTNMPGIGSLIHEIAATEIGTDGVKTKWWHMLSPVQDLCLKYIMSAVKGNSEW